MAMTRGQMVWPYWLAKALANIARHNRMSLCELVRRALYACITMNIDVYNKSERDLEYEARQVYSKWEKIKT